MPVLRRRSGRPTVRSAACTKLSPAGSQVHLRTHRKARRGFGVQKAARVPPVHFQHGEKIRTLSVRIRLASASSPALTKGRYRFDSGSFLSRSLTNCSPAKAPAATTPAEFFTNVPLIHEFPTTKTALPSGRSVLRTSPISRIRSMAYRFTMPAYLDVSSCTGAMDFTTTPIRCSDRQSSGRLSVPIASARIVRSCPNV